MSRSLLENNAHTLDRALPSCAGRAGGAEPNHTATVKASEGRIQSLLEHHRVSWGPVTRSKKPILFHHHSCDVHWCSHHQSGFPQGPMAKPAGGSHRVPLLLALTWVSDENQRALKIRQMLRGGWRYCIVTGDSSPIPEPTWWSGQEGDSDHTKGSVFYASAFSESCRAITLLNLEKIKSWFLHQSNISLVLQ